MPIEGSVGPCAGVISCCGGDGWGSDAGVSRVQGFAASVSLLRRSSTASKDRVFFLDFRREGVEYVQSLEASVPEPSRAVNGIQQYHETTWHTASRDSPEGSVPFDDDRSHSFCAASSSPRRQEPRAGCLPWLRECGIGVVLILTCRFSLNSCNFNNFSGHNSTEAAQLCWWES